MLSTIPHSVSAIFIFCTLFTLGIFWWVLKSSPQNNHKAWTRVIVFNLILWLIIQAVLSFKLIYSSNLEVMPPKILMLGVLPNFVLILILFNTKKGKAFIDGLSIHKLTYLHLVRIPVEIGLLMLFLNKAIPEIMTFEGWNFDIIAGLTAPFIIYFGFVKKSIGRKGLLVWNILCMLLLFTIIFIGVFSSPIPLQMFGFDQPNKALLYFPFSWLPSFIVPMVLFAHFVSIRQLLKNDY